MWPCNIPTVTTSRLLILRMTFTTSPRWPSWEGGWPRRHPPWLLCSLSPVPETQPPPPAALPRTTSAQASGGAKSWTSPAPGSAPRPFRLSAWGCGELCWDRTTDNPGACVPTGIPPALCAPKLILGERELRYAAISARLPQSPLQKNGPHWGLSQFCIRDHPLLLPVSVTIATILSL